MLLGHITRKRVIHSVRAEFERTAREIEGGLTSAGTHPLTNSTIHWPKKEQLCFPVFVQGRESNETCADRTAPSGGLQLQRSRISEPRDSTVGCPRALETCPHLLPEVVSSRTPSPLEFQSLSSLSSSSPALSPVEALNVVGKEGEAMAPPEHSTPSHSAPRDLPNTTISSSTQPESPPPSSPIDMNSVHSPSPGQPVSQLMSSPSSSLSDEHSIEPPSPRQPASPHATQTSVRGGESVHREQLASDDTLEDCGDMLSSGPAVRMSFPRDRSELLELRGQLVMELVWLRQAIASRQSVSHDGGGGLGVYTQR